MNLIISPHSDDAIFSLGAAIQTMKDVVIVSPFDGMPNDEKGRNKHLTLNSEHINACQFLDVGIKSGQFLDDVYEGTRDNSGLVGWFKDVLNEFPNSKILVPLGIKHPDHVLVRDIFIKHFRVDVFYEELPYRVRFSYLYENLKMLLLNNRTATTFQVNPSKEVAVRAYASQVLDPLVITDTMVEERIWE